MINKIDETLIIISKASGSKKQLFTYNLKMKILAAFLIIAFIAAFFVASIFIFVILGIAFAFAVGNFIYFTISQKFGKYKNSKVQYMSKPFKSYGKTFEHKK